MTRASGEIGRTFLIAMPASRCPFVIRAAVVEGVATATEVSTIGIVYAVLVGLLIYRQFDWRRLKPMLVDTACLSGAILLIIGTATGMAWGLTQSGFSGALASAMTGLPGGALTFMAVSIIAFIVLGSVLEGIPPSYCSGRFCSRLPSAVGIHEVHYAMVVILAMGIGLFAPPFGVGYYAACAIGRVEPAEGMRPILGIHAGAIHRHCHRRCSAVDIHRLPDNMTELGEVRNARSDTETVQGCHCRAVNIGRLPTINFELAERLTRRKPSLNLYEVANSTGD